MEKERKEDARVVRTRRDLRAAMAALMEKRPFDKISVSEVCATAAVNRMTFYKHYRDKYDLLNDVILDVRRSVMRRMEEAGPVPAVADDPVGFSERLIDAVLDECLARRAVLTALDNDQLVVTMVATSIEKFVSGLLRELDRKYPLRYKAEVLAVTMTGAASFLVRYWLEHRPEQTKEQLLGRSKEFLRDLFDARILFADSSVPAATR